jgi:hypothetical protein
VDTIWPSAQAGLLGDRDHVVSALSQLTGDRGGEVLV